MRVVCKYTHSIFIFGSHYDAAEVFTAPAYENGKWYSRHYYEIPIESGKGLIKFKGDADYFYTIEEYRELQLDKVFD